MCFDFVLSFTPWSTVTQHPAPTAKSIARNGASDLLQPNPSTGGLAWLLLNKSIFPHPLIRMLHSNMLGQHLIEAKHDSLGIVSWTTHAKRLYHIFEFSVHRDITCGNCALT